MLNWLTGFRKFTLAGLFLALSTALMLLGYFDGKDWVETGRDVVVAFLGTNIGEHLIGVAKDWIKSREDAV